MFPPNLSLLINAGTKCPKNTFIITAVGSTVQTSTARYGGDTFITFASHCHTFIFIKKLQHVQFSFIALPAILRLTVWNSWSPHRLWSMYLCVPCCFLFQWRREFVTFCNKDSRTCRATSFLVMWHSLGFVMLPWETPLGNKLTTRGFLSFYVPLFSSLSSSFPPVPVTQTPNTLTGNKDWLWHDLVRRV